MALLVPVLVSVLDRLGVGVLLLVALAVGVPVACGSSAGGGGLGKKEIAFWGSSIFATADFQRHRAPRMVLGVT